MIHFVSTIDNKSNKEIKDITVSLVQCIKFFANKQSKVCQRKVAYISYPKLVKSKSSLSWNVNLSIPPIPTSSSNLCKIIDISYILSFSFDGSGIAYCIWVLTSLFLYIKWFSFIYIFFNKIFMIISKNFWHKLFYIIFNLKFRKCISKNSRCRIWINFKIPPKQINIKGLKYLKIQ